MPELRDYQRSAIDKIRNYFAKGKKNVLLVAPTGSGKTVIASSMIDQALSKGKSCLFVAHRRELVMQCSRKLADFRVNHGVLMANKSETEEAKAQVASVQTFTSRKDRDDFVKPQADLVILDEAHRSVSNSFQELINEYPNAYVVGLTATPCRSDGRGLGNIYDELVEAASIQELIDQGYLVPNRILAPTMPDLKGIKIVAGDYEKRSLDKKMNTPKLVGDIITHWQLHGENRPTVVFASSINHSQQIARMFNNFGIAAGHIDGVMPELEREQQLNDLDTGKIKVLCNCQVLTEGWDQPKVSCVIIARPTRSYVMYLQMVGRSLRPAPNKKDTLIIDHSGSVYQHGFPEDTPAWILTEDKIDLVPKEEQPIDKQPFTCIKCDTVYKPTKDNPECPNCAFVPTKKETELLIKEGRLVELKKEKTEPTAIEKQIFYSQLKHYGKSKGFKPGWADWTFKEKYGHFPHTKKIGLKPPTEEVKNFIKHLLIKKAKRREKYVRATTGIQDPQNEGSD